MPNVYSKEMANPSKESHLSHHSNTDAPGPIPLSAKPCKLFVRLRISSAGTTTPGLGAHGEQRISGITTTSTYSEFSPAFDTPGANFTPTHAAYTIFHGPPTTYDMTVLVYGEPNAPYATIKFRRVAGEPRCNRHGYEAFQLDKAITGQIKLEVQTIQQAFQRAFLTAHSAPGLSTEQSAAPESLAVEAADTKHEDKIEHPSSSTSPKKADTASPFTTWPAQIRWGHSKRQKCPTWRVYRKPGRNITPSTLVLMATEAKHDAFMALLESRTTDYSLLSMVSSWTNLQQRHRESTLFGGK